MEKKNKIIIAVLVIIIIALVAAIGFMFFGDMNQTKSNNTNVTVEIQSSVFPKVCYYSTYYNLDYHIVFLVFAVWFKFQLIMM